MPENWETSIYPIVKDILESNFDELLESYIGRLANDICQEIDKEYVIERRVKYGTH